MAVAPIRIENDSVIVEATVDGHPCEFVIDSGDAIGPTFTTADAQRLGLSRGAAEGIEGAGGASDVWATQATIALGGTTFTDEPGAVDASLEGYSLLGLPFFLARGAALTLNWTGDAHLMLVTP